MATYRELKVWQVNQSCIKLAFELSKNLPDGYAFQHIWRQLFRALTSAGANIAEGQSSYEGKEFARYIGIAIRSAIEADHWVATIDNLLGKAPPQVAALCAANLETIKMLKGLLRSIEEKRDNHD